MAERPLRFIADTKVPIKWKSDYFYAIYLGGNDVECYVTSQSGVPKRVGNTQMIIDIINSQGGGGTVDIIESPDSSISIGGTVSDVEVQVADALQTLINNALQPNDNISELNNDSGYITSAPNTDLSITDRNTTTLQLDSSTGDNVVLPSATPTLSGLMSAQDKTKIDALPQSSEIPKISTKKVTLSAAQILSLNIVPVELVAAPSAGKFIQLLGVSYNVKNGNIAFSGGVGELRFNTQGLDTTLQFLSADGAITSGDNFNLAVPVGGTDTQLTESSGIQVSTSTPVTQGNGTIDIYITYQTFNI